MKTNLFNQDPNNGFTSDISLGGLPIFTEDIQNIQNNSTQLFGILSMLKGTSCILRGCYADEITVNGFKFGLGFIPYGTVKLTEGVILLNDIVYYIPEGTYDFPFVFIKGTETADTRIFKDGSSKDVAIQYDVNVRVLSDAELQGVTSMFLSFTDPNFNYNDYIFHNVYKLPYFDPINELLFNPVGLQRAEHILVNRSRMFNEVKLVHYENGRQTKTETGKDIINGSGQFLGNRMNYDSNNLGWLRSYPYWGYANSPKEQSIPSIKVRSGNMPNIETNFIDDAKFSEDGYQEDYYDYSLNVPAMQAAGLLYENIERRQSAIYVDMMFWKGYPTQFGILSNGVFNTNPYL